MPDPTPMIVGALVGFATIFFVRAIVGRSDAAQPRCRACQRDARPFAWREPRTCDCGADLARANAVQVRRWRGWKAPAAAILLFTAALLVARHGVHLARTGGQWRDSLPAPLFGALLGNDLGRDNIRSLGMRVRRGLGADEARAILTHVVNGRDAAKQSDELRGIVHDIVQFAPPLELDDASARLCLRGALAIVNTNAGSAEISVLTEERGGTIYVRPTAVEVDGRESTFEVRDRWGHRYADWFPIAFDAGVQLFVRDIDFSKPQPTIAVRGELAIMPTDLPLDGEPDHRSPAPTNAAPIMLRPEQSLAVPTRGRFALTCDVMSFDSMGASTAGTFWSQAPFTACESIAMQAVNLDHDEILAGYAGVAVGVVMGTMIGLAVLVLGLKLTRGGYVLEPPRCVRCSMQLRGAGDTAGSRCAECGADLTALRSTRWVGRRGSPWVVALIVPVALVVGASAGGLAGLGAGKLWPARFGGSEPWALQLLAMIEAGDDEAPIAWMHLQLPHPTLPLDDLSDAQACDVARRVLVLDKDRFVKETFETHRFLVPLFHRLKRIAPAPPELAVIENELIGGGSWVRLPAKALVGDPIPVQFFTPTGVTAAPRIEGPGLAPRWGVRPLPAFTAPGRYELAVEFFEQVDPPSDVMRTLNSYEAYERTATHRRRETRMIEIVTDVGAIDEAITDPARDPFAPGGVDVSVSLFDTNGCREAMLCVDSRGAELLVGRFELLVDGNAYLFRPVVLDSNYPRTLLPSGAMPATVQVRYTPQSVAMSQINARIERPHWAVERTVELAKTAEQTGQGRRVVSYRVK